MNKTQIALILIILLVSFKLLMMEETLRNPSMWNKTQAKDVQQPQFTSYNTKRIKIKDNYTLEDDKFNILKDQINISEEQFETNTKSIMNNIFLTTVKPKVTPVLNHQRINQGRAIRMNNLKKVIGKERMLKNCGSNCNNIWKPLQDNDKNVVLNDRILLVNDESFNSNVKTTTEDSLIARLKSYMNYKSNSNYSQMKFSEHEKIRHNCNTSLSYMDQNCLTNNSSKNRRHDVIHTNKRARRIHNSAYWGQNRRKKPENPFHHNRNKVSYVDDQSSNYEEIDDWSDQYSGHYGQMSPPPYENDEGYKDSKALSHHTDSNEWHEASNRIKDSHEDDTAVISSGADQAHDDGYRWYPNSHTDDAYNKYNYNKDDVSKYEDKRALSRLQDMYYCSKYCHCCKKGGKRITLKYNEYGGLGKFLSIMKYFGFDSGYNFFYGGRSSGRSSDSHYNPMSYFKDYYKRFYGPLPTDDYNDDDESFVFFDKDKQPDTVSDCKEVCECCEDNKKEKLKKKFEDMKKKEAKRKKKLEGLTGLIRYLIFSDEDGYYDFVDGGKPQGRSYSGNHYNSIHEFKRKLKQPDYDMNTDPDLPSYDVDQQQYQQDAESYPELQGPDQESYSDHDHEVHDHDDHDHDHHVEEHHPKLILFDCSKCCRFCKKTKDSPRRRRRRRKKKKGGKGLLDFLQGLLTGVVPGEDDGDYALADDGSDDGKEAGDVSLSFSSGSDYFYDYYNFPSASIPSPSSNTTCCFNSTSANNLIIAITIALIVLGGFSSVNVVFIVIVPLIFFGLIIIFIFLLLQAIVPVYFIPIFIIVLIIALIPILLLVLLFFLLLPMFLAPVFFPFILRLGATTTGSIATSSLNCARDGNSTINCAIVSAVNGSNAPLYTDDTTDYFNGTFLETTTDLSFTDYESIDGTDLPITKEERQLEIPDSLYWKINSVLGKQHCLERAGCHLAIYTNSVRYYNKFILRLQMPLFTPLNLFVNHFVELQDPIQMKAHKTRYIVCDSVTCSELDQYAKRLVNEVILMGRILGMEKKARTTDKRRIMPDNTKVGEVEQFAKHFLNELFG